MRILKVALEGVGGPRWPWGRRVAVSNALINARNPAAAARPLRYTLSQNGVTCCADQRTVQGLNLFKFGWLIFKAGFWDFWGGQAPLFGLFCGHNAWAQWPCHLTCMPRQGSSPCSSPLQQPLPLRRPRRPRRPFRCRCLRRRLCCRPPRRRRRRRCLLGVAAWWWPTRTGGTI